LQGKHVASKCLSVGVSQRLTFTERLRPMWSVLYFDELVASGSTQHEADPQPLQTQAELPTYLTFAFAPMWHVSRRHDSMQPLPCTTAAARLLLSLITLWSFATLTVSTPHLAAPSCSWEFGTLQCLPTFAQLFAGGAPEVFTFNSR
jgi:hypothetical protein